MFGGKRKSAKDETKEMVKKWSRRLRSEMRAIDRELRTADREEAKLKLDMKKEAARTKNKPSPALRTLAKAAVQSKNHRARLVEAKARINSTVLSLKEAEATAKVVGHVSQSAQVMKSINGLMSVSSVAKTAREMQRELAHAGVVQEMVDDSFAAIESDDVEAEADEEIDAILNEVLSGELGKAGVIKGKPLRPAEAAEEDERDAVDAEEEKELEAMRARLARLDNA